MTTASEITERKLWNPLTKKTIYSSDVIFKGLRAIFDLEQPKDKEKENKVHFETKKEDAPQEEQRDGFGNEDEEEEGSNEYYKKNKEVREDNQEEVEKTQEQEEPHTPILKISTRQQNLVYKYSPPDFCYIFSLLSTNDEPISYKEAIIVDDSESWIQSMQEKMVALDSFNTWELAHFPKGRNIGSKWIFKKKFGANGSLERFKARLVAKCYS